MKKLTQQPVGRLITNVLVSLTLIIFLSACSTTREPLEITIAEVERPPLIVPTPDAISLDDIQWIIITEENVDEALETISNSSNNPVAFSISSEDYERLSRNFAKIRQLVLQQQVILQAYKDYYESEEEPEVSE